MPLDALPDEFKDVDFSKIDGEYAKLAEGFMKTFESFKEANDARLEEVKKGFDDVVSQEKVEAINADLTAKLAECQESIKAIARKREQAKSEAELEHVKNAKAFVEAKGMFRADRLGDVSPEEAYDAYQNAFKRYLRVDVQGLTMDEQKALAVGSAPDGGYYVEPVRSNRMIEKIFETSAMRSIAEQITISSTSIRYPVDRDEASSGWVGETEGRPETGTPQIGQLEIPVHEQYANPKATQSILDDAQIDLEAWLDGKISDKFAREENAGFVNGDGVTKPKGFLTLPTATTEDDSRQFGTLQHIVSGKSGDFADIDPGDALISLVFKLKAAYRAGARWVMNRSTVATVRKLKYGDGTYMWQPNFQNLQATLLLGFPISEFEDMPDIAANTLSIGFGNFRLGYVIVDRQGVRQLRDPFTAKPFIHFYTTKRTGGGVTDSDAIKLLKFAA